MAIQKARKCPVCHGYGVCNDGSTCPACNGSGEVGHTKKPLPEPCRASIQD